ncbi:M20/M25/M40 family metallo-hydrolase [Paenisporosarcina sp. TG20]|uniref:M20/M25/M40 family metallo-hydrolase n=1 Tax=Paenisporosarcina sp. TG20 TaxID=1211706 RepID=UPI00030CF2E1|nr:M20/M25/M40 family metallo-hydrolase [Paenisporosarcina sp. TG20]
MVMTWSALLTRYGFVTTQEGMKLKVIDLTNDNRKYLESLLEKAEVKFKSYCSFFEITDEVIAEEKWVAIQGQFNDGITEMSFNPAELPIAKLDLYIAGMVMQLNRLGFTTIYSCDGHEKGAPHIFFQKSDTARTVKILLNHFDIKCQRKNNVLYMSIQRQDLPGIAGELSEFQPSEIEEIIMKSDLRVNKNDFNSQLETLLNIPGESGRESKIRQHVLQEITPYVDHITVDHYGNILAKKRFGSGPTILLNAHLDTVEPIEESRVIVKKDNIWTSNKGILGADDRAGVHVIIATLKSIQPNDFKGTLKIIFTVEEEIGLLGAREVNDSFLWNVDMALVIDRRGTNDIVTHNYKQEFCNAAFGLTLERIARANGLRDWKAVSGGLSDTAIWASHNVQSVNLSAGYLHEHTDLEQLDVEANYNTYLFVNEILGSAQRIKSNQGRRLAVG